jgi:hypothetical protein
MGNIRGERVLLFNQSTKQAGAIFGAIRGTLASYAS